MWHSVIGLGAALLGCADGEPTQARPSIELVEELRLDATAEDFSTVGRVYVGPNGEIAVPLPQDRQIRMYDSTGRRIAAVGRRGSGPGEFEGVGALGWKGDTLWAYDSRLGRITYIARSGTVLRTDTPPMGRAGPFSAVNGLFLQGITAIGSDGSMLGNGRRVMQSGRETELSRTIIVRVFPDGATWDSIVAPPAFEDPRWFMEVAGFGRPIPFAASPLRSMAPDASHFAFVTTDVTSPDGGTYTLSLFDAGGDTLLVRTYPFRGVPIPPAVADSAIAAEAPRPGEPTEGPANLGRRFQQVARERMPPVYPPMRALLVGLDDTIWLTLRDSGDVRTTLVLDQRGDVIGSVTTPVRFELRQASASRVWMTETDADGLASVVRFRVTGLRVPEGER